MAREATLFKLTKKETAIHELMERGYTNPEIMAELGIGSRKTLETHISNIYSKVPNSGEGNGPARRVSFLARLFRRDADDSEAAA